MIKLPFDQISAKLETANVQYQLQTHEKAITSLDVVKLLGGFDIENGAKSIVFKTDKGFKLVIVRGSARADYSKVRKHFGAKKIRMATPEEVFEVMRVEIGACYPFGSVAGIDMIVDQTLAERDEIHFSPGTHFDHITISFKDYAKVESPILVDVIKE